MMRVSFRKHLISIAILIVLLGLCSRLFAFETDFKWRFYLQDDDTFYPIENDKINISELKSNLYIFFKPEKKVFLYLLLSGPEDDFFLIFPDSFSTFTVESYIEDDYILPGDGNWDNFTKGPGEYKVYFIVSKNRLKNLEEKIIVYRKNKDKNSISSMKQLKMKIIAEISQAQRDWFFSDNKDIPNSSLGTFRNDDISSEYDANLDWFNILDISDFAESAYDVSLDKEGFIKIFTFTYE